MGERGFEHWMLEMLWGANFYKALGIIIVKQWYLLDMSPT